MIAQGIVCTGNIEKGWRSFHMPDEAEFPVRTKGPRGGASIYEMSGLDAFLRHSGLILVKSSPS